MIEFLPAPDHVLAMRIRGRLDGGEYDRIVEAVEAKLAAHQRIGVYWDMTGFADLTPEAMAKDVGYHLSHFGQWSRFPRLAFATDKGWIKMMVAAVDPMFPQFEAKCFAAGQDAEAIAWAAAIDGA